MKQGLHVKKCKFCGRYFVLTNKHDADFCDRIYRGNRTCKAVGAKKAYNERVQSDPVLQEYQRIYKRYFAREENPFRENLGSKFYGLTFLEWAKIAKEARKEYKDGIISGEDMLERIKE